MDLERQFAGGREDDGEDGARVLGPFLQDGDGEGDGLAGAGA